MTEPVSLTKSVSTTEVVASSGTLDSAAKIGKTSPEAKTSVTENSLVSANFDAKSYGYHDYMIILAQSSLESAEGRMESERTKIKKLKEELEKIDTEIARLEKAIKANPDNEDAEALNSQLEQYLSDRSSKIGSLDKAQERYAAAEQNKNEAMTEYQTAVSEAGKMAQTPLQEMFENSFTSIIYPEGNVTELKTKEDFAKYGFNTDAKISNFKKLDPKMQKELVGLMDFARANGLKVSITSSFRSNAEQTKLYERDLARNGGKPSGFSAKPGTSQHEFGRAIDIKIEGADMRNQNDPRCKLLGEYWKNRGLNWGGTWRGANEPWHFDLRPAKA